MFRVLFAALSACFVYASLFAGTLADDSARFSRVWGLRQAGDPQAAKSLLADTSLPASGEWNVLANFLSAYFAFADSDFAEVPQFLDLGVPVDLQEHASWLRAEALTASGQPHLAGIYWRKLLNSALPDYRELAAEQLRADASLLGRLDTLQALSTAARSAGVSADVQQKIDLDVCGLLTAAGRHAEASDVLRATYLRAPATLEGKSAAQQLTSYKLLHGFAPPDPGWNGEWHEIELLEKSGLKSEALDKLTSLRARGRYAAHDEQMLALQARLCIALRRHDDALRYAQQHLKQFPQSSYRDEMRFCVVRSAYLKDQDSLAIRTAEELSRSGTDQAQVGEAWRLIALLYVDRDSLDKAAAAASKWYSAVQGQPGADDALWMRGWTRFLSGRFESAATDFARLVQDYPQSGYVTIGHYWAARAYGEAGQIGERDSLCTALLEKYPYSYYAQLSCEVSPMPQPQPRDMRVLPLSELYGACGRHTRAFAQLIALGLWEYALREWPQVEEECGKRADIAFWRPLLYWKNGQRFESWKWIIKELRHEAASVGERPADFYELWYPLDYQPLLLDLCKQNGVDPYLALGVICQESHFDEEIVSPSGAVGLMQLMPSTAKEQAKRMGQSVRESDLFYAPRNMEIGVAHLADLQRDLGGDTILTLCAYNAGINAARRWQSEFGHYPADVFVELIPYRETRLYVKHILQHIAAYRRLYPDLKQLLPGVEP